MNQKNKIIFFDEIVFLKQKKTIFKIAVNPLLNKDETGPPYMADTGGRADNQTTDTKHIVADIPDSWVLIDRVSCQKPRGCPHQPQRGCVLYRLHILFYYVEITVLFLGNRCNMHFDIGHYFAKSNILFML